MDHGTRKTLQSKHLLSSRARPIAAIGTSKGSHADCRLVAPLRVAFSKSHSCAMSHLRGRLGVKSPFSMVAANITSIRNHLLFVVQDGGLAIILWCSLLNHTVITSCYT
jgi:hypothetical protein